ncbi:hypothetical protein WMF28_15775 [Sorangium sp. So ce590]
MFAPDGRLRVERERLTAKADELDRTLQRLGAMRDGLRHRSGVLRAEPHGALGIPGTRAGMRSGRGLEPARALWIAIRRGPDPPSGTKLCASKGQLAQICAISDVFWHKFRRKDARRSVSEGSGPRCVAMHCG